MNPADEARRAIFIDDSERFAFLLDADLDPVAGVAESHRDPNRIVGRIRRLDFQASSEAIERIDDLVCSGVLSKRFGFSLMRRITPARA